MRREKAVYLRRCYDTTYTTNNRGEILIKILIWYNANLFIDPLKYLNRIDEKL